MSSLLQLVQALVLELPYFRGFFLATRLGDEGPTLLDLLKGIIIRDGPVPGKAEKDGVAVGVLDMVEVMNWNVPETLISQQVLIFPLEE